MAGNDLFELMPDRFFESLRLQMKLGVLASEKVETVLKPLLKNYDAVMPQLDPVIQAEIEDILRIYPEIAEKYDLKLKLPPLITSILDELWEKWNRTVKEIMKRELIMSQVRRGPMPEEGPRRDGHLELLRKIAAKLPHYGRGRFMTDKRNPVFLELTYDGELGQYCFQSPGLSRRVHVHVSTFPLSLWNQGRSAPVRALKRS